MVHEAGPRIQKRKQHAVENAALPLKCSALNLNIEESYVFDSISRKLVQNKILANLDIDAKTNFKKSSNNI